MPDMPDFWNYRIDSSRKILTDLAEAVVRLGSPITFHRGGSTIFFTDGRHGLSDIIAVKSGTGADVVVSCDYVLYGGYSYLATCGSTLLKQAGLQKQISQNLTGRIGLECSFAINSIFPYFNLFIYQETDEFNYEYQIRWDLTNGDVYFLDDSGSLLGYFYAPINYAYTGLWHTTKLIIDSDRHQYHKLFLDQTEIDLSGLLPYNQGVGAVERFVFEAVIEGLTGSPESAYLDCFVCTADEEP